MTLDNTLRLFDMDGTVNTIDVVDEFSGKAEKGEVWRYFEAAIDVLAAETGLSADEIAPEIFAIAINEVYPERGRIHNWGSFPAYDSDGISACATEKITPAVDHFQLCKVTSEIFLKRKLEGLDKDDPVALKIHGFMSGDFGYKIFRDASEAVLPYVRLDEEGISVVDEALKKGDLITLFTNSTTEKAVRALQNSGFGTCVIDGGVERGKVGAIGGTKKWCVDKTLPLSSVKLNAYFEDDIELDLRRGFYYAKVRALMKSSGATRVAMFSDVPSLDLYPLWDEFGKRRIADPNVFLGMKINPISLKEDISAVVEITGARASRSLKELYDASF